MADDYEDYDDTTPAIVVGTAGVPDVPRASAYLSEQRKRASAAGADFESIMKQRAEAVTQARSMLDQTIQQMREGRKGGMDPALMAMAAGFLKTTPGVRSNFFGELGNALGAAAPVVAQQRMADTDFLKGIADLQQRSAALGDLPLKDAQTLAGKKQLAAEAGAAKIEAVLARGEAPGSTPARLKEYQAWLLEPGNEGKPYSVFAEWRAKLGDRAPASVKEFEEARAKDPSLTYAQFLELKAQLGARGRETGKSQAEGAVALPAAEAMIDQMQKNLRDLHKHPGLPKSVGWGSLLPTLPEGEASEFEAILETVKDQAFLVQFDKLRGAGAITEAEGRKATNALMTLNPKMKPEAFRAKLKEAMDILETGRAIVRKKAGAGSPESASPFREGQTATGPNGEKWIFKGGKWGPQ